MPRKILVLERRGSPWNCHFCDAKPKYVVHDYYQPYEPTDAEVDSGYIPYDKTCRETFCCGTHYTLDYLDNPDKYNDPTAKEESMGQLQANFTSRSLEDYNREGQKLFAWDE